MNPKHDKRRAHLDLLAEVLGHTITEKEKEAFEEMRTQVESGKYMGITERQEQWVRRVLAEHKPTYTNDWSAGRVPRGAEVPTPKALQNLPKFPPGRRA